MQINKTPIHLKDLERISDALVSSGYISLDEQAKALGVSRSTAWTIVNNKHKLGRLSIKTINRILSNRETPSKVRAVVQEYVARTCPFDRRSSRKASRTNGGLK